MQGIKDAIEELIIYKIMAEKGNIITIEKFVKKMQRKVSEAKTTYETAKEMYQNLQNTDTLLSLKVAETYYNTLNSAVNDLIDDIE